MTAPGETSLALRGSIPELVGVYQSAVRDVTRGYEMALGAEARLNAAFAMGDPSRTIHLRDRSQRVLYLDIKEALDGLRRECWTALVERAEIRRVLSEARAKELDARLDKGELPEITVEAVADFTQFYMDHASDMLAEAIQEVFEWLRPRSGYGRKQYKRNSQLEVPAKIVLEYMVKPAWLKAGFFRVDRQERLLSLDRVFQSLAGQGEVAKTYRGPLCDAIEAAEDGFGQTEHFAFKCFKNGNLHLVFLKPDLLAQFNRIAGGKRLRPQSAA